MQSSRAVFSGLQTQQGCCYSSISSHLSCLHALFLIGGIRGSQLRRTLGFSVWADCAGAWTGVGVGSCVVYPVE